MNLQGFMQSNRVIERTACPCTCTSERAGKVISIWGTCKMGLAHGPPTWLGIHCAQPNVFKAFLKFQYDFDTHMMAVHGCGQ